MKISSERALFLSRILFQKLTADPRLLPRVDKETLRGALTREINTVANDLERIEADVRANLEKRKGSHARDFDLLFSRDLEAALRKHGV